MCGIAGYAGPRQIPDDRIDACLRLMRRRGPDGAASRRWTTPAGRHVCLLHARLRIIDLDPRADQPFRAGTKWIATNGELYNYLELRQELEADGVTFETASDTEVLVHAIDRWGWSGLDRCEGMWAFGVYDEADGSLVLSRDRFGEKPLVLYRDGDGVYFGSEPKFVTALLGRRLPVDMEHLYRFLVNGYRALYKDGHTFFAGLTGLPPASLLRIDASGREERRSYWSPRVEPDPAITYDEAVAGVRERLIRAVEIRLRADVPLAFCMSGGVDSNGLIGIARHVCGHDVHGFTITMSDPRYDETEMVEHAVGQLGIRHTSVPVKTDGFLDGLSTLVRQHDAPVSTISYFAHWRLMAEVAAHGYRIAVSGTAADELFTGYYDHHLAYLYELRDDPAAYRAARDAWVREVRPFVRNPLLQDPDLFVRDPGTREHLYFRADELAGYLCTPWSEPFTERSYAPSLLRNRMLNELFHEAVPVILHEDDANAMHFSIENRSPYLDRELFEFAGRVPTRHLVRGGLAKALLRDALRGLVPDRVLDNPRKVGFNAPMFAFLDVTDPAVVASLLAPSPIFEHVRRDRIAALLEQPELPNSESKFLFSFVTSRVFLEAFA